MLHNSTSISDTAPDLDAQISGLDIQTSEATDVEVDQSSENSNPAKEFWDTVRLAIRFEFDILTAPLVLEIAELKNRLTLLEKAD